MARPTPSCAHDYARLRLPSASSPQKSEAGKKEPTDHRLNRACQPCVTPSSRSSLDRHLNVARTAEDGCEQKSSVNKSAKVVLADLAETPTTLGVGFGIKRTWRDVRRESALAGLAVIDYLLRSRVS